MLRPVHRAARHALALATALLALLALAAAPASAADPTIVNSASASRWLESLSLAGEADDATRRRASVTLVVKHDVGRSVTGLRIDDDYNGTDNASSATVRSVTAQQPNRDFNYSRVTYSWNVPNVGFPCSLNPFNLTDDAERRKSLPIRVRAQLDDGAQTQTVSSNVNVTPTTNCLGPDEPIHLRSHSQSATSVNTGGSVTFTFTGDDPDSQGSGITFQGINWRMRRLSDGTTSGSTCHRYGDSDNTARTLEVDFPERGRWVVEAELLTDADGSSCTRGNKDSGKFFYIGAVDVNSPGTSSPTLSLDIPRPDIGETITATATTSDPSDAGEGGLSQMLEWDLNNDGTYEDASLGDVGTGLTTAQRQRSINTTGMTPGVKTIKVRVTDNGAISGADNSRATKEVTQTFRVDSPPVADAQTVTTDAEEPVDVTLTSSDADNDAPTYSITDTPDNGALTGSGANLTYTPDDDFAGEDQFTFKVDDGFGGSDTETVELRVRPETTITVGPDGPTNSTTAGFTFESQNGTTFECDFNGLGYSSCTSPVQHTGLADDDYTFDVRATSSDGIVEEVAAHRDFTVDTAVPDTGITAGPDEGSTSASATPTFEFSSTEAGSTFKCQIDGGAWDDCTTPETLDALTDGSHTLNVQAIDPAGNADPDPATRAWISDTTAPGTDIVAAPDAATNSNSATFEFDSADDTATFQCSLDGASFLSCDNPKTYRDLTDGPHTLEVRAVDPVGNADVTPDSHAWTVDTAAPDTTIDTKPALATQDTQSSFTFTSSEGGSDFTCTVDGGDEVDCDGGSFTTATLEDGQHVFTVAATDAVGNADASAASYTWTVDNGRPNTSIEGGPDGPTNSADAEFELDSNELNVTYECKTEADADFGDCTSPVTRAGLTEGSYSLTVKATDAAGNEDLTPATREWTVDLTDPTTQIVSGPHQDPDGLVNSPTAAFAFDSNDPNATFECKLDDAVDYEPCAKEDVFPDLDDGPHTLIVRARDAAGNEDKTNPLPTAQWEIDATVPVSTITDGPAVRTSSNDADFTFGSDGGDDDTRECKLDDGAWEPCNTGKSFTDLGDGQHTFRVRAEDAADNVEGTPASWSWTIDTAAPQTTVDSGPDASTNVTDARFEFSASEAGSSFECKLDAGAWQDCTSAKGYTGLLDGPHTFQVRASDDVENLDASPATHTWTVDRTAPQTAIDAGPNGLVRSDAARFEFSSSEGGSTFQCKLDDGNWLSCGSPREWSGLGNGEHTLQVRATDAAGNVDGSPAERKWTVRTSDAPDTTIVSGPSGTVPTGDAAFAFSSSDDAATFECSLDGSAFAACASPAQYSGLSASAHTFQVRARDPQGAVDATPASRTWTIALPAPNSPGQPGDQEAPPATCKTFKEPAPCQPASLATLLSAKKAKTKSDLTLTAKSGGPELDAVTYTLPRGLTVKAVKKALGKNVGTLTLKTAAGGRVGSVIKLKLPKKVKTSAVLYSKSGVRVNLRLGSRPSVTVSGLPAGVTEVVLALKGKSTGLIVTPKKCASLSWSARMGDRSGGSATAKKTGQLCSGTGGKR